MIICQFSSDKLGGIIVGRDRNFALASAKELINGWSSILLFEAAKTKLVINYLAARKVNNTFYSVPFHYIFFGFF